MIQCKQSNNNKEKRVRVPGRRSSKPLMEKRRRARINTCLEILKSYVLKETTENMKISTLTESTTIVGKSSSSNNIRASAKEAIVNTENIEQFLISELKNNKKSILKNSNLANKGRRNPNKLEKADILELTVDYVRRLHEQRDRLQQENCSNSINIKSSQGTSCVSHYAKQLTSNSKSNNLNSTSSNNSNDVSLTLQIEQLIRIPASNLATTTTTTTTTTNLSTTAKYLKQSDNSLMPLSVKTTPSQIPPSPPSSASTSPLSCQHFISSTTDDDYYEEPLSMVVCDNSRLRERQPRPWRPWDIQLD